MKMASNDFGNVVDTFYQALQKTQTIPGALKAVVDAIPETGALTGKAMELTREQIGNACHAWLQKAMEASKSVRVLDPEEVIEAVTPHVQYAAIPETGALTEEQWVRIDEEHLPKEGDEVGYWSVTGLGELWLVRTVAVNWNLSQCRSARWTHYRPNNAPTGKESHD